jgi:hypothetical protein
MQSMQLVQSVQYMQPKQSMRKWNVLWVQNGSEW